jgi:hypothetical protein
MWCHVNNKDLNLTFVLEESIRLYKKIYKYFLQKFIQILFNKSINLYLKILKFDLMFTKSMKIWF